MRPNGNATGNDIIFMKSKNGLGTSAAYALIHRAVDDGFTVGQDSGGVWGDRVIIDPVPDGEAYLVVARFNGSEIELSSYDENGLLDSDVSGALGAIDPGTGGPGVADFSLGGYLDAFGGGERRAARR